MPHYQQFWGDSSVVMVREPKAQKASDEETEEVIRGVAERLAAARKERGLTQLELGELADLSQQRIFELEQGTANVTVRTLVRMARILDIDLPSLFSGLGLGTDARLAETLDHWIQALEEQRVHDNKLATEIVTIIESAKALAARKPREENVGGEGASPSSDTRRSRQRPKEQD
jgi:transcriptional regulator with XRE-family HTH domain